MHGNGVSAVPKNQSIYRQLDNQTAGDTGGSANGWKYLTVREGGKIYTYIVIGKNMRILIGESTEKKTEAKDKKTADGQKAGGPDQMEGNGNNGALASPAQPVAANDSDESTRESVKTSFLTDTTMLALTGYYQKKMRETIKNLGENLGNAKVAEIGTAAYGGKKTNE